MVNFHIFLAIFFLFNAIHGLREWPQSSILPSEQDVHQRLSSLEQKTENNQESEELLNNYNSFTKLTHLENVYSNELTEPTTTDTTYEYNNFVLTTAITFHKESITSHFKNAQKDALTGYIKGTRHENEDAMKTYQSLQNIDSEYSFEGTSTVSELDLTETTTENQFWVLTPARRIYYGHKTKIKHFPFLVTVHFFRRLVCGGSIIKSNLVITAASCLRRWQEWLDRKKNNETTIEDTTTHVTTIEDTTTNQTTTHVTTTNETTTRETTKHVSAKNASTDETKKQVTGNVTHDSTDTSNSSEEFKTTLSIKKSKPEPDPISVRIGTNYYRLDGEVVQVVQVHFHPAYQKKNLRNNLAILELKRHLIFNHRNIDGIDIRMETADVPEGTNVTIAGWGAQTYHNKIFNALWNLIQKSVLTVIGRDECIESYTSEFVDSTNFCARNEHDEAACNGDGGDPAVINGELVGVTSYGSPKCGAVNATTVFTNLGYYSDWIEKIMADIPISKTSEEDSSDSKDTNHTKHTSYTKHANHTRPKNHTKHTNHTQHTNHTKYSKYTKHKKQTNLTKHTEKTTICFGYPSPVYYSGQRYRKPSPVYYRGQRYRKPSPVYYSGERYRKPSPVYYNGERYRKPSPVYYSGQRYREPSPVYYSGERYQKPSPLSNSGERYRKPFPVYDSGERYRKPSRVYDSGERYRKPSPVYYSGERYRKPSPVYYSGQRYQEQMNFQQSLTHWRRGYRRIFEDKLRETFSSVSSTDALKLREKITDSEKDRGFLTISPLRFLTSSMQYTYGSEIFPEKSTRSETNARIENNFLLTPNTPEG